MTATPPSAPPAPAAPTDRVPAGLSPLDPFLPVWIGLAMLGVCPIRDEIRGRVVALLESLGVAPVT